MAYQEENIDNCPNVSEEDSLLTPGMLSESQEHYLDSYNRLIAKGFLSTLTKKEYEVWRLFTNTKLPISGIADELQLSMKMVRKHIKKVTIKLREELETECNWNRKIEPQYSRTGAQKYIRVVTTNADPNPSIDEDHLFKARLKAHKKEVDAFLKAYPLVSHQYKDSDYENN
jgi:DNA-binding CsgD family transcriptional regulator